MTVMTVTARYAAPPDEVFARALDLETLNRDMGGLLDYYGLPRGSVFEGQSYEMTLVLWTLCRQPPYRVTVDTVDHTTRELIATTTQFADTDKPIATRTVTRITPDGTGSLWSDRVEMIHPPPSFLSLRLSRYITKAMHRRRRGRSIRVSIEAS